MTTKADPLLNALKLPGGARFYRCALQVNPFEYLSQHKKQIQFKTETDYNNAIIQACQERKIEVIAVTDHYCVRSSKSLVESAMTAGIHVFPGFEAVTKDGVHFLCLFDPNEGLGLAREGRWRLRHSRSRRGVSDRQVRHHRAIGGIAEMGSSLCCRPCCR